MFTPILVFGQDQVYFSETWTQDGGESALFYKNSSTTDNIGNVYMAGSAININNNHDIIVQKFDPDGGLLWEETFNGAANMDDFAADIFVDDNYNVFVTGSSVKLVANDQDLVVLKYNSSGVFQWYSYYDNGGSPTPKDFGTSITGDNNGSVYVTGGSFGATSNSDFITLGIASNNGTQLWEKRYDYAALQDVAAKIKYDGNSLFVSGGSQINFNKWELATLTYNPLNGDQLYEIRSQGNATQGVDEVYDLTVDNLGNVYIAGAVRNLNSGYDMSVYKLDPQLNILWEKHHDGYGADDKGKGVKVDDLGNVYLAGFVSNPNEGKNYSLLKYNSAGVLQWAREFNGQANLDDEAVQLVIASNQDIFVTGTARNNADADIQTLGYKPNGELFTQAIFEGVNGLDDMPTGIAMDLTGNIIVVGKMGEANGNYRDVTVKYSLYLKPFSPVIVNGEPSHNANEVIIRFDRSSVNYAAIDRKAFVAGNLSDFVKPSVISLMNEKLKMKVSDLSTFKIFMNRTTADTLSITRLGDTVKVEDFWAALTILIPPSFDVENMVDDLNELKQIIHYAQPNHIGSFLGLGAPNDTYYSNAYPLGQTGLFDSNYGINVEGAWNQGVFGTSNVKVGVYDSGINWHHEDYGDGTWNGSKVKDGWDYTTGGLGTGIQGQDNPDPNGHGSMVSGIIGALRNNGKGIAGIAGGDVDDDGNTGVEMYSFRIGVLENDEASIARAIEEGCGEYLTSINDYDIQNYSWKNPSGQLLRSAVKKCHMNSVVLVAASDDGGGNTQTFPASYKDDWIMKVGGSDESGNRYISSAYGYNLDFLAPATSGTFQTLENNPYIQNTINTGYITGNGTSFAAPHASGVAALMLSQHNPSNNPQYINTLAPEDVENMLKRTATPVTSDFAAGNNLPVPNDYAGYGRINAGEVINKISIPYMIKHYTKTVNTSAANLYATYQNIDFPEGIPGVDTGPGANTIGTTDVFKLTSTFAISGYNPVSQIDIWVRNSSSDLYGLTNTLYNNHWSDVVIDNVDQQDITMTGYIYKTEIIDNLGGITYKWFPSDLMSIVNFAYSVYSYESYLNVENNNDLNGLVLFPNPATNELSFTFEAPFKSVYLELYDVTGKEVKAYEFLDLKDENYQNTIDISNLTNGLYFCKFSNGKKQITRKFIKQ